MPRRVPFSKYHGLGNDFLIIDAIADDSLADFDWPALAPALCRRHTSIGADGVLILRRTPGADASLRIINADGSDAEMCGNGLRCAAKRLVEHHARPRDITIRTPRGTLKARCEPGAGAVRTVRVEMGVPVLDAADVPVRCGSRRAIDEPLPRELAAACADAGIDPRMTCVGMGNPHAVLFCDDAGRVPLASLGARLETHPIFPRRINLQFAQVLSSGRVSVRTWERGAGATLACGTGACAVAVAGVLTHRTHADLAVLLPGGELRIHWPGPDSPVSMTGPAEHVFDGELTAEPGGLLFCAPERTSKGDAL